MSGVYEAIREFWSDMKRGDSPLPSFEAISPQRCEPPGSAGRTILPNRHYFTVRVNEMHLAANRDWWSTYDPLVLIVTEFTYGGERVAIPKVIGPSLIQKQASGDKARYGVVILNQLVTGPHPYRGGGVDISAALYRVERANYARALVKVVDTLSASLGAPADMLTIAKTGVALLSGVEGLLGLAETTYLAGFRVSLATSMLDDFTSGYYALVTPPVPRAGMLTVSNRRLAIGGGAETAPYRDSDFVLVSVSDSEFRDDESLLPFYPLKVDAMTALWDSGNGEERAKANLISAYQLMRKSPDVTDVDAGRLFDSWLEEFQQEKSRLARTRAMGGRPDVAAAGSSPADLVYAMQRLRQL